MEVNSYNLALENLIYKGNYVYSSEEENNQYLIISPELEVKVKSHKYKTKCKKSIYKNDNYIEREYLVKKFILDLIKEIDTQKLELDLRNEKIINYWKVYSKSIVKNNELERKIKSNKIYRNLQTKKSLFLDILTNNDNKYLLLTDDCMSPRKLGFEREDIKIKLNQIKKELNQKNAPSSVAIIDLGNDFLIECFLKKIENIQLTIFNNRKSFDEKEFPNVLVEEYNGSFITSEFVGKFDYVLLINSLHLFENIELLIKFSKLLLRAEGKLVVTDFYEMDPLAILTAIFFQEKFLYGEYIERNGFFYKKDYIKKTIIKYFDNSEFYINPEDQLIICCSKCLTDYSKIQGEIKTSLKKDFKNTIFVLEGITEEKYGNYINLINNNVNRQNKKEYLIKNEKNYKEIKEIWAKNLNENCLYPDSNFFKLGGNSLSATKVISEVEISFNCKLGLNEIFEHSTLYEFYNIIENKISSSYIVEGEI